MASWKVFPEGKKKKKNATAKSKFQPSHTLRQSTSRQTLATHIPQQQLTRTNWCVMLRKWTKVGEGRKRTCMNLPFPNRALGDFTNSASFHQQGSCRSAKWIHLVTPGKGREGTDLTKFRQWVCLPLSLSLQAPRHMSSGCSKCLFTCPSPWLGWVPPRKRNFKFLFVPSSKHQF